MRPPNGAIPTRPGPEARALARWENEGGRVLTASRGDVRRVREVIKSRATVEGAGVKLHRAIGFGPPEQFDPFLLLDDFRSDNPADYLNGFPWHPHRGMETITYVLRGDVEHSDSLGNRGVIAAGDLQWMTAGSGIIHQEMPKGDATGAMHGFQLWANLPAANKMMSPRYRGVTSDEIPHVEYPDGVTIKLIAGTLGDVTGPVRDVVTSPEFFDVSLPARTSFTHRTSRGHTVFAYVIGGEGRFDTTRHRLIGDGHVVLFGDGDAVSVIAEAEPVRFLLISGRPIREPIAWEGPIVMNTQEELRTAFEELERGAFIEDRRR